MYEDCATGVAGAGGFPAHRQRGGVVLMQGAAGHEGVLAAGLNCPGGVLEGFAHEVQGVAGSGDGGDHSTPTQKRWPASPAARAASRTKIRTSSMAVSRSQPIAP